jgi:DNA-binding response OmpR family regulator
MATVLIIEDDAALREALAYNLRRDSHDVLLAADGTTGLRLAREQSVDLVLLDLMLPGTPGLDVFRMLRTDQQVPIIVMSALDAEADRIAGLEIGADDYVAKPFSMRELLARVNAQLRRHRLSQGQTRATTLGERIVLDSLSHEVRCDDQVVALRPKEFELLEFLMRHQGMVQTRDQVLEAVWGMAYTGGTRTVDVHMRWLREKLELIPSRPRHLVTVRGVGYKFVR